MGSIFSSAEGVVCDEADFEPVHDHVDGRWKLLDTIKIRHKIEYPRINGCIGDDKVMITDWGFGKTHTYILDLNTKNIQKVINGTDKSWVFSCAVLNDEKVVCGRYLKGLTGYNLPKCISIYDKQLNHIKDFTINGAHFQARMGVATDKDGMIIAAVEGHNQIRVINPADGNIVKTISSKESMTMHDVLSSGHILALPFRRGSRAFIIDKDGDHRELPHGNDKILNVSVDQATDDIYIVTSDDEYKTCVIDQVKVKGNMKKRRVASFPLSVKSGNMLFLYREMDRQTHLLSSRVTVTSSGKVIACDGYNIFIFKKIFTS